MSLLWSNSLVVINIRGRSRCRCSTGAAGWTTFVSTVSGRSRVHPSFLYRPKLTVGSEYSELDLNVAAEIVLHTQNVQRSGSTSAFPPNPPFTAPQFPQGQPQQPAVPQLANPNSLASLISSLDGPTLQSLLAALQQRQQQQQPPAVQAPQQQFPAAGTGNATDLATLLSNATRQQNPVQPVQTNPQQPLPGQQFNVPMQGAPMVPDPNLMSLLAKGLGGQPPQGQASVVPQVQNIVNQLAKWKQ